MTRLQLRTLLRKRIQEVTADQWTDSDLNLLMEMALYDLEKEILSERGDAFIRISTCPRTANKTRFLLPAGCIKTVNVEVKTSASSEYLKLKPRKSHKMMEDGSAPVSDKPYYDVLGKWLEIRPAVTTTISAGIRLRWVPTLTMDDDTVTPEPDLVLHEAIALGAKVKAFQETDEDAKADAERLQQFLSLIPRYYRRMEESVDQFELAGIDVDRSSD